MVNYQGIPERLTKCRWSNLEVLVVNHVEFLVSDRIIFQTVQDIGSSIVQNIVSD